MLRMKSVINILKDRWRGLVWCRCDGKGFWMEQSYGPVLHKVLCPDHWYLEIKVNKNVD